MPSEKNKNFYINVNQIEVQQTDYFKPQNSENLDVSYFKAK